MAGDGAGTVTSDAVWRRISARPGDCHGNPARKKLSTSTAHGFELRKPSMATSIGDTSEDPLSSSDVRRTHNIPVSNFPLDDQQPLNAPRSDTDGMSDSAIAESPVGRSGAGTPGSASVIDLLPDVTVARRMRPTDCVVRLRFLSFEPRPCHNAAEYLLKFQRQSRRAEP
jgi:hypothetical protein